MAFSNPTTHSPACRLAIGERVTKRTMLNIAHEGAGLGVRFELANEPLVQRYSEQFASDAGKGVP